MTQRSKCTIEMEVLGQLEKMNYRGLQLDRSTPLADLCREDEAGMAPADFSTLLMDIEDAFMLTLNYQRDDQGVCTETPADMKLHTVGDVLEFAVCKVRQRETAAVAYNAALYEHEILLPDGRANPKKVELSFKEQPRDV